MSGWILSATPAVAVGALVLVWVLCARILLRRDAKRLVQERFPNAIEPEGSATECKILFMPEETSTPCAVQATPSGWYMFSPPDIRAKYRRSLVSSRTRFVTQPVLIPWAVLEYRQARFPLLTYLRFDVPSAKIIFFVPKRVALPLLREAGRGVPGA